MFVNLRCDVYFINSNVRLAGSVDLLTESVVKR